MDNTNVIIRPLVTEKSTHQQQTRNAYAFQVHPNANKPQIKKAVETIYSVKVVEVRTMSVKSKPKRRGVTAGRTRSWKKAVVQVKPGDSIPIFQGLQGLED